MEQVETKNAIIRSARLTIEERDILDCWLDLDYGGSGQGFGGYSLYLGKSYTHQRDAKKTNFAGIFIYRLFQIAGVKRWDQLVGKTVRVRCSHSRVHAIGHIVDEDWFDPRAEFDAARAIAGAENTAA